ncbi:hypothetical protein BUE76_10710 [Cnuella takakiae]|nr:hypothetical protein BUE76_10710 [Cnuella takakiae]
MGTSDNNTSVENNVCANKMWAYQQQKSLAVLLQGFFVGGGEAFQVESLERFLQFISTIKVA